MSRQIVFATERDIPEIIWFIRELAKYEKLENAVTVTPEILRESLFGAHKSAEVLFLEDDGVKVAFAVFFHNFSTFLGRPGIYLEDLFVRPECRGKGYGKTLLAYLAKLTLERGCGRLEWSVLDWNTPALDFYRSIGAEPMNEWTVQKTLRGNFSALGESVLKMATDMNCPSFLSGHCRSCSLLNMSYEETLHLKEERLKNLIHSPLLPTVGLKITAKHSRNKAKLAVYTENSEIRFGFYNSEQIPQALENCPLHLQGINALLPILKELLKKYKIDPYSLTTKKGELKYILITQSDTSGDTLIRFILRSKASVDALKKLTRELRSTHPEIKVTTANIQPIHQAILEGEEEIILTEQSTLEHTFDEFTLHLGPRSFFQVTPEIARELYRSVAESVKRDQPQSFLDLYCGVGAFSFYASRSARSVTGIEISKDAIACADRTKSQHGLTHLRFEACDVEAYLNDLGVHSTTPFDAILVNPPRRGLNDTILKQLLKLQPQFIYYSSCNAETLSRDLTQLTPHYTIQSAQIFDMFPYTEHFETLVSLKITS